MLANILGTAPLSLATPPELQQLCDPERDSSGSENAWIDAHLVNRALKIQFRNENINHYVAFMI